MKNSKMLRTAAAGITAAAMLLPATLSVSAATMYGDANLDGAVTMTDAVFLTKVMSDSATFSTNDALVNSDLDGDGVFTASDLSRLLMYLSGQVAYSDLYLGETTTESDSDHLVVSIEYADSSVTLKNVSGNVVAASDAENVTVTNNTYVEITQPGEYDVSGSCAEGQLNINCDKTTYAAGQVTCNLLGLTLSNTSDSPVYVTAIDDEFVLTVKKGYTNTISDGTSYTNADASAAAIYSCDDMKIKGNGTLIVNGNCDEGIACKNDLKIWNSTLQVTAVGDGIRGKDSLRIGDPDDTDYSGLNVTVKSTAGDGIKSTSTETDCGFVRINGGTVAIDAMYDGIKGEQTVEINGGDINILTYQVGSSYTASGSSSGSGSTGSMGGGMSEGNANAVAESAKGIKAVGLYDETGTTYQSGGDITINGGTITVDSADDSLHCAGTMTLAGGTFTLSSADDAIHTDNDLHIGVSGTVDYNAPFIDIKTSYEGVEGLNIYQYSGSVLVTSTDDGYNAAGGTDSSGSTSPGGWGQGSTGGTTSGAYSLTISGGYVYVNARGDGLDSNGALTVSGGYAFVSQTGDGNAPIDCDSSWTYSGGVVIAGGSSGMFSESIPASYQFLNSSNAGINAGETVTFVNGSGTVLGTMTFSNSAAALVICAPESGTAYKGGTVSGATYFSTSSATNGGNMKGGYGGTISNGTALTSSSSGGSMWG